jgi:hypothetical protein
MKGILYKYKSEISTFAGLLVAVGTAWSTIDFSTFIFSTDWPKLIIPTMIAIGGYVTQITVKEKQNGN